MNESQFVENPARYAELGKLGRVCRLGLATRGNTHLEADAVLAAIDRGVDYLNWCGHPDGMSRAVRRLGSRRREVFVAVQLDARTANSARRELAELLGELGTDYVDVVTYYYVERREEWEQITGRGGAAEALQAARADGTVRAIGLTSHQRTLAAEIAEGGELDLLMIRYNAAHRGAEEEVFPLTLSRAIPVVTYTGLRWGALLRATPDDPPEFELPTAGECYRFMLCHPGVTVGLMAPDGSGELEEDLALLDDWRGLSIDRYEALRQHGDRVHRHGGSFP